MNVIRTYISMDSEYIHRNVKWVFWLSQIQTMFVVQFWWSCWFLQCKFNWIRAFVSGKAFFFLFSIQHSVRVSRKKLWKIGFSLPLCFPLEYRTIYWNFTRAKNFMEIFPLRSNKREATSILSSLQLKLEKYCFQLGFSLHFWAFVIHYAFRIAWKVRIWGSKYVG